MARNPVYQKFSVNEMINYSLLLLLLSITHHSIIFKNITLVYCRAIFKNPSHDSMSPREQTGPQQIRA